MNMDNNELLKSVQKLNSSLTQLKEEIIRKQNRVREIDEEIGKGTGDASLVEERIKVDTQVDALINALNNFEKDVKTIKSTARNLCGLTKKRGGKRNKRKTKNNNKRKKTQKKKMRKNRKTRRK